MTRKQYNATNDHFLKRVCEILKVPFNIFRTKEKIDVKCNTEQYVELLEEVKQATLLRDEFNEDNKHNVRTVNPQWCEHVIQTKFNLIRI